MLVTMDLTRDHGASPGRSVRAAEEITRLRREHVQGIAHADADAALAVMLGAV
jgi:hypothetical protein